MLKNKIDEKLNEKKWYIVRMTQESLNVAVIAALQMIKPEDRQLVEVDYRNGIFDRDVVWYLNMNPKQKIAIKEACSDYIVAFTEKDNPNTKTVVWK